MNRNKTIFKALINVGSPHIDNYYFLWPYHSCPLGKAKPEKVTNNYANIVKLSN